MAGIGTIVAMIKALGNKTDQEIAQIEEDISEVKSGIQGITPDAQQSDIGKALILKTIDQTGKPTAFEYGEAGGGSVDPSVVEQKVDEWLEENISNPDSPPLDRSLSSGSAAAPADIVGTIVQETKNIFDKSALIGITGITVDENGYFAGKVSAWNTAFSSLFPMGRSFESGKRYNVSFKYFFSDTSGTYSAICLKTYYTDESSENLFILSTAKTTETQADKATASSKSVSKMAWVTNDWHANNYILHIKDIQVEEGTSMTEYVPYLTGKDEVAQAEVNKHTEQITVLDTETRKRAIADELASGVMVFDDWEQGDINASGNDSSSTTVLRTKGYHRFSVSSALLISPKNSYKCAVRWYTYSNGTYTYVSGTTASDSAFALMVNKNYYYRFVIVYGPGGQTAAQEWANNVKFVTSSKLDAAYCGYNLSLAHRCLAGYAPEETKAGIQLSKEYGFDYFECDIKFTSDGVPVLIHDTTIDRTSDGTGNVADFTFDELQAYDFGSWFDQSFAGEKIPSLEQALQLGRQLGIGCCMEVQDTITDAQLEMVIGLIVRNNMQNHVMICGNAANLIKIYALRQDIDVGLLKDTITAENIASVSSILSDRHKVFFFTGTATSSVLDVARAANVPVIFHTANTIENMVNFNAYLSGVMSNYYNYRLIKYMIGLS